MLAGALPKAALQRSRLSVMHKGIRCCRDHLRTPAAQGSSQDAQGGPLSIEIVRSSPSSDIQAMPVGEQGQACVHVDSDWRLVASVFVTGGCFCVAGMTC